MRMFLMFFLSLIAQADHNTNWQKLHSDLDSVCGSNNTPVCVGHQLLSALEKSGLNGPELNSVICTCDNFGYIRCSIKTSEGLKITKQLDVGEPSECNQVRPLAERRGIVCDNFGNVHRLDQVAFSFEKGEDLGDFSDCLKQINP